MIRKYRYGTPFDTEALTEKIETAEGAFPYGEISQNEGFAFTYIMDEDDIVYGLGESNRGINKRGYCYISNCTDDAIHTEGKRSLYSQTVGFCSGLVKYLLLPAGCGSFS